MNIVVYGCDNSGKTSLANHIADKFKFEYIRSKGAMAADTMAGLFAAKEALVKCLGTGFQDTKLCDIVVLHDKFGAPYYELRGSYAQHAAQRSITTLHLTITHDSGIAAAVAIAERAEK